MRFPFLMAIAFLCWPILSTQAQQRTCSTVEYLREQIQADPSRGDRLEELELFTRRYAEEMLEFRSDEVITIPVVVHLVYNTDEQNLSDEQILSQIEALNEDFRRANADADDRWPQAADTRIRFCLADVSPAGGSTTGIERRRSAFRSFRYHDQVKFYLFGGLDAWPADQYLNIWVCNLDDKGAIGFAQMPGGNPRTDGVVIDYAHFGRHGTAVAPFNLGRTTTHEVGHWLNLRHIWGDGPCGYDDYVSDTPPADGPTYGCETERESCGSINMAQNFMDYSYDACMNLFTAGQATRMWATLAGPRAGILTSAGCSHRGELRTGATDTCGDGLMNGEETGVDCGGPDCPACKEDGCGMPEGLTATSGANRRAELHWQPVAGAHNYAVQIRKLQPYTTGWSSPYLTTNTSVRYSGFRTGDTYEWRLQAHCDDGSSDFATLAFIMGQNARRTYAAAALLTPNPANDHVAVNLSALNPGDALPSPVDAGLEKTAVTAIDIISITGRHVLRHQVENPEGTVELNTSTLPSGIYFVRISNAEGKMIHVKKLVINHK